MPEEVTVGGRYRNNKTGNVYIVLHNAVASWDVHQSMVIYQREDGDDKKVWVRSLAEFKAKFEDA